MKMLLSPQRMETLLVVSVQGDAITLNGETFDFSPIQDGDVLASSAVASDWLARGTHVERVDGEIVLTLVLPFGAGAPDETRFPAPITVSEDGPVVLPPHSNEEGSAA